MRAMVGFEIPSDREMLEVIISVLVDAQLAGIPTIDSTEGAVKALRERWPEMPLKVARAAVTRLRIL